MQGGDSKATGGDPAADVVKGPYSSHENEAPADIAPPLLTKFMSFCYQIASGMVCWVGGIRNTVRKCMVHVSSVYDRAFMKHDCTHEERQFVSMHVRM